MSLSKRGFLALFFLAPFVLEAQTSYIRAGTVTDLPKCKKNIDGVAYAVRDATSDTVLGVGGGTAVTIVQCEGDTPEWETLVPPVGVGADLQGDPDVDIDTTDPGSDVIITPVDDFLVTAGDSMLFQAQDAFEVFSVGLLRLDSSAAFIAVGDAGMTFTSGDNVLIDATAGNITLDTDAVGSDVVITPADDLQLNATDDTSIGGDTIAIGGTTLSLISTTISSSNAGNISFDSTGGAVGITLDTDAAGSDITLTPADDLVMTVGDTLLATGVAMSFCVSGGNNCITNAATSVSLATQQAGADVELISIDDLTIAATDDTTITGDIVLFSNTTTTFDPGGSTDELTIVSGSVRAGVALGIPSAATLPTCDSTIAPAGTTALYWDTTGPDLCACPEGVDWVTVDGSGTCA